MRPSRASRFDPGTGWHRVTPRKQLARGAIRPRAIRPGGPHRLLCRDSHFAWFWLKSDGSGLILGDGAGKVQAAMTFSGWSLRAENSTLRFRREVAGDLATFPVEVGTGRVLLAPGNIRDRTWLVRRGEASELDLKTGRRVRTVSLPIAAMPTAFVEDHLGRLWVGTSRGLFVADPRRTIRLVTERDEPAVEKPSAGATREVEGTTGLGTVETRPPRPAGAFAADGRFWVGGDRRPDVFDRDGARKGSFKYKGTPLKPPENRVSSALLVDRTVLATMTGGYYVGEGGELKNLDVELVAEGISETPFLARLDVLRKLAEFYSRNTADAPANSIDEAELRQSGAKGTLLDYLKSKLSPARIREFESRAFLEAGGTLLAGDDDDGLAVVRISGTRTAPSLSSGFEDGETADKVPAGPHVGSPNPDMRSREETLVVLRRTPGKVAWTTYRVPTRSPDIQGGSMVAGPSPGQLFAIGTDGEAEEDPPADYSLDSLENDLHVLLKHWEKTSAPRAPRVVFQVNEISRFNLLPYGTLLQFRSLFITDPRVKAVLSGRSVDRSRDTAEDSPWWNFIGKEIEVEPLTPDDARSLLVKPVSGLFTYREDAIQKILARGEGKPLALQQIGRDILQYKYDHGLFGQPITLAEVDAALSERRATDGDGRAGRRDESTEREEAR